jgi:hypothetical protein
MDKSKLNKTKPIEEEANSSRVSQLSTDRKDLCFESMLKPDQHDSPIEQIVPPLDLVQALPSEKTVMTAVTGIEVEIKPKTQRESHNSNQSLNTNQVQQE